MIGFDLQKFAKSLSQIHAYREAKRILKQNMPGQKAEKKPVEKQDFRKGRLTDENIRAGEVYTLYMVKGANDSHEIERGHYTGKQIEQLIDSDKLDYDARKKVWVGKKGYYVLRRRRR